MAYALVWPASVLAFLLSVWRPSVSSPIVQYLFLSPVALFGAIATVRAASRARRQSPQPLRLATLAATIGWVEIILTIIVSLWITVEFVNFLEHEHL
jgi:hypothetical protein